jgi:hypothetical protein
LNAVDKCFIAEKMRLVTTPGANESSKRIALKAMVEGLSRSIAEEAARLCSDMTHIEGVKSEGKKKGSIMCTTKTRQSMPTST